MRRLLFLLVMSAAGAVALFQLGVADQSAATVLVHGALAAPNAAGTGRILFVKDGNLWVWQDGRTVQLTNGGNWWQPNWSADGTKLAYVLRARDYSEIFTMESNGSNLFQLTRSWAPSYSDNTWAFRPTWSPSGDQIAYLSDARSFQPTLWLMNADGSRPRQLIQPSGFSDGVDGISWAPDGTQIAVASFRTGMSQIYILTLQTGALEQITQHADGAFDPAWSPSGRLIAYAAREEGTSHIFVASASGEHPQRITASGPSRAPTWSPDGRYLAYLSARNGSFDIWVAQVTEASDGTIQVGEERALTNGLGAAAPSGLSWAR